MEVHVRGSFSFGAMRDWWKMGWKMGWNGRVGMMCYIGVWLLVGGNGGLNDWRSMVL